MSSRYPVGNRNHPDISCPTTSHKNKNEVIVRRQMANRIGDLYAKPWVVKKGVANVDSSYVTLAIPLTMGLDGVYASGAQVFSQFNRQNPHSELTKDALQIMCCIAEDGSQGTPTIHGLKRSDPRYGRTVGAIWRKRQGKTPMAGDRDLIRDHVRKSIQFCPVLADIYWKLTLHAADPQKWNQWKAEYDQMLANANGDTQLAATAEEDQAIEVPHEVALAEERNAQRQQQGGGDAGAPAAKQKEKRGRPQKVDYAAGFVRKQLRDMARRHYGDLYRRQEEEEERERDGDDGRPRSGPLDTESKLQDRIDSYFITIPRASPPTVHRITNGGEDDDDDDDSSMMELGEDGLDRLLAEADKEDDDAIASQVGVVGAVFVMFIKDKNFNPGQTLSDIMEAWKRRQEHRAQNRPNTARTGGRRSQYVEPYAHLYDFEDHFVWHASKDRLNHLIDWVHNTSDYTHGLDFISPLHDVHDGLVKNPAHPENLFTLERALSIMKAHGGDAEFCNIYTWLNHARCGFNPMCYYKSLRPLDWQLTRGQHTYHYKQSKMIWGTHCVTGLAYEYFPHIDTEFQIEQYLPPNHRSQNLQPVAAAEQQDRERALAPLQSMHDVFERDLVASNGTIKDAQKPITKELANISRIHWRTLQHDHNQAVIKRIRSELMPKLDQLRWDSQEYQLYAKCMTDARRHLLTISGQFFFPNKQVLSESMNAIYEWFYDNCAKSVGTFVPQYVHGMDVLGNWWVLEGQMTRHDAGIVRYVTRYLVMHWGAHDVYRQFAPIPMHPGFFNYGPGKAGTLFGIFISLSLFPSLILTLHRQVVRDEKGRADQHDWQSRGAHEQPSRQQHGRCH